MSQDQATPQGRLERAKQFLTIAESGDAKREAYKAAAEEIAAHIEETGDSQASVATDIGCERDRVHKILRWRKAGYPEGTTPFTMADGGGSLPTDRAATSHTKKVLREQPQSVAPEIAKAMEDPEVREAVARHMTTQTANDISDAVRGLPHEPVERERRRKEAETFARGVTEPIVDAFSRSNVLLHLEQALEDLQEVGSIDSATHDRGLMLLDQLRTEFEVKRAMEGVR